MDRINYQKPLSFITLPSNHSPTGVLWQEGPLLWVYLAHSPGKTLIWYPQSIADLILKGIKVAVKTFGIAPSIIITPYSATQLECLASCCDTWAIVHTVSQASFDNHYPKHPWLQFCLSNPVVFPRNTRHKPIPKVRVLFTDGSKTGIGAIVTDDGSWTFKFATTSAQQTELLAVMRAFELFPKEPFNLLSDSQYVVNAVSAIECAGHINPSSSVLNILRCLQQIIWDHSDPFFIGHIRAHTSLPGPLAEGNHRADSNLLCLW